MKQLLYALVAIGVLLLGFSLVFLGLPGAGVEQASQEPVRPAPAGRDGEVQGPSVELVDAGQLEQSARGGELELAELPTATERAVVAAVNEAHTVGRWESPERRTIRGRVVFPAGAPADPTLTVIALTRELDSANVYGKYGALSKLKRHRLGVDVEAEDREEEAEENAQRSPRGAAQVTAELDAPAEPTFEEAAPDEGERSAPEAAPEAAPARELPEIPFRGLVAIAPVAADGTFAIPFPADQTRGWLAIDGRYLYSLAPHPFDPQAAESVELTPQLGGWLTGVIHVPVDVDDLETVMTELRVELEYDPSQFNFFGLDLKDMYDRIAVPSADGRFEFRGIPTPPPYVLTGNSDYLASVTMSGIKLDEARDRHVELTMVYGASVSGRVVDEAGMVITDADLRAATGSLFGFATNRVGDAKTDEVGAFHFPHLPPGKVQLSARKPGFLDSKPVNIELADREVRTGVELTLSAGASVGGRVLLPDGRPAAGVEVDLGFDPDALAGMAAFNAARGAEGKAVTDEDGAFLITGLGRGPFLITLAHEIDGRGHAARKSGIQPGDLDVELRLRPDPVLRGVVTTLDGAAVPAFTVRAELDAVAFWMGGQRVEQPFEHPDGEFSLPGLREGTWKVQAFAPGTALSEAVTVDLPVAEDAPPLALTLVPEAVAMGVVFDPDGEPILGATVREQLDLVRSIVDAAGLEEVDASRTAEDGTYTLGGLPAGTVSVIASHPDYVDSKAVAVELGVGQTVRDVNLQLRRGGVVTGEVFNEEGKPAGGVMIVLQDMSTFVPTTFRAEPDGTFRREGVKPGKLQVTAMIGDVDAASMFGDDEEGPDLASFISGMRTDAIEVVEGEESHLVLGAPPSDPVRLSGTITHLGEPLPKAMVTLFPEGGTGIGAMKFTTTDTGGRYSITLDHPGNYLMQVQIVGALAMAQDNLEFPQVVPEGEEHVIDVELPAGRLEGTVVGGDGQPVAQTRITLTVDGGVGYGSFLGGRYVEAHTDENGRFLIDYLPPNVYSVAAGGTVAGGMFGGTAEAGRVVRTGIVLTEGEHLTGIDFRLREPGEITGQVVDTTGSPVAEAAIFVRNEEGQVLERFSLITTDSSGRFRYTGVAPGRYSVSARTTDLASFESDPITVPEGGVGQARIVLEAGTLLKVSVVDQAGGAVRAKLLVLDEAGRQVNGMISYHDILSSGSKLYSTESHETGPLAPGSYKVTAVADDGRTVTKPVTLSGQAERTLKIRLR